MGANTFMNIVEGKNAAAAFSAIQRAARYDNGHGGYSGTIAEKNDFVVITIPKTWTATPQAYAKHLIDSEDSRIDDKWGPAGCISLGTGRFLFFGWASS